MKKEYYSKVSNHIEFIIKKSTNNSIDLFKIIRLISNRKIFLLEMKAFSISLFGKKFGNYLASLLGSKSSKAFIRRKKSTLL